MRRRAILGVVVVLAVGAVTAYAAIAPSKTNSPGTVRVRGTTLGRILVDAKSHTLYLFEKDRMGKSACTGACAKNWPPLLVKGRPKAGAGVKAAKLGTTKRSDGSTQVTYNRHPLYTFVLDAGKAGSTKGEGLKAFGAEWYVVGPGGSKVEKKGESSQTQGGAPAPNGY